jgi:hypothetical protein
MQVSICVMGLIVLLRSLKVPSVSSPEVGAQTSELQLLKKNNAVHSSTQEDPYGK